MIDQARSEGVNAADDLAVKLMVHQIAFLSVAEPRWDYGAGFRACERKAAEVDAAQGRDVAEAGAQDPAALAAAVAEQFSGRSGQTEGALVGELISDIVSNERYDKGGRLDERTLDHIEASLSELADSGEAARSRIQSQCRGSGPGM
jgi:hypothetical protein